MLYVERKSAHISRKSADILRKSTHIEEIQTVNYCSLVASIHQFSSTYYANCVI